MEDKKILHAYMTNYPESCNLCRIGLIKTYTDSEKWVMHENYFLIGAVKSGKMLHHIGDVDIELRRGDMYIIPPGVVHNVEYLEPNTEFYAIEFTKEFLQYDPHGMTVKDRLFTFLMVDMALGKRESLLQKVPLTGDDQAFIFKQIERFHHESLKRRECMFEVLHCILMTVITFFGWKYLYETDNVQVEQKYWKINQMLLDSIDYIHKHYRERITLEGITTKFAISKAAYCNLFKEGTGTTFLAYLNNLRCEKATQLLIDTNMSLEEIADVTGYADVSGLYRNFTNRYGISPGRYRKQNVAN